MSVYKRGGVYWFHFVVDGHHVQKSTKQGNEQIALRMEQERREYLASPDSIEELIQQAEDMIEAMRRVVSELKTISAARKILKEVKETTRRNQW
jgi:uncharacterized protein (DUF1015 family)